jgi:uncharacterized protein (TIGR00251 family)
MSAPDFETRASVPTPGGVRLSVFAKPRASKDRILGIRAGALEVAVSAPPVDGAANQAVVAVVAKALGLPKTAVRLDKGHSGRHKILQITGLDLDEVVTRLGLGEGSER